MKAGLFLKVLCFSTLTSVTITKAEPSHEYIFSGKVLPKTLPLAEAVVAGNTVYLSGAIGNLPGQLKLAPGGIEGETKQTMDNIKTILGGLDMTMDNIVKCSVMMADIKEWGTFNGVYKTYFNEGRYPARAAFGVNGLALAARVEVDCIAVK